MESISVLLVEDEQTLALIIKDTLDAQGFSITTARNGEEGLRLFFEERPQVVVADVMMPRMDGFEMVRRLRQHDRQTPVLFLTARSAINDVVEGFELGANDYLKKPFGMQELIVRIKALANRFDTRGAKEPATQAAAGTTAIGRYLFNPLQQRLEIDGTQQLLSHREAQLLRMLSDNRGAVVGTQAILLDLWGDDSFFNTRSLQVFITRLRHRLAQDEHIRIINVRGIGYKLLC